MRYLGSRCVQMTNKMGLVTSKDGSFDPSFSYLTVNFDKAF